MSGTAISTSHSADACDCCCLHVQAKSSQCNFFCRHIYGRVALTTALHVTGTLELCYFQRRAKSFSLSQWDVQPEETHFARSHATAKVVVMVFSLKLRFAFFQ